MAQDKLQIYQKHKQELAFSRLTELYSASNSMVLRAQGNLSEVLMQPAPKEIHEAIEGPKLNFLTKAWGQASVSTVIGIYLDDTASALGFKTEGTERVTGMIVRDLMEMYSGFSLEEFALCFTLIRQRKIGGKTFGKENWELFYVAFQKYNEMRSDEINQQHAVMKENASPKPEEIAPNVLSRLVQVFAVDETEKQEKEKKKEEAFKAYRHKFIADKIKKEGEAKERAAKKAAWAKTLKYGRTK